MSRKPNGIAGPNVLRQYSSCDAALRPGFGIVANRVGTTPCRRSLSMSADANRCPGCGAPRPANDPEGLCPRCLMLRPTTGDTPGPTDVDATTALAATGSGQPPEPTSDDPEATTAHIAGPVASTAPHDATDDWTSDANRRPARPTATRRRPHYRTTPPSATSATMRFRKSWVAAAWASSTRRGRSR